MGMMSIGKLKIFIVVAVLIIFGVLAAVFLNYRQMLDQSDIPLSSFKKGAQISLSRVRQTATRDGITEWRLGATSAEYSKKANQALLKDLSVTFFLEDGKKIDMTANRGMVKTDSNNITASGNVVVTYDQYQLNTQHLQYGHRQRLISTHTPVTIRGNAFDLKADSMVLNLKTKRTVLKGNIKGVFIEDIQL